MADLGSARSTVPTGHQIRDPKPLRGPPARLLGRSNRIRDNAASTMQRQLEAWLVRFAREEAERAIASMSRSDIVVTLLQSAARPWRPTAQRQKIPTSDVTSHASVIKAPGSSSLQDELRRILDRGGEAQIRRTVRRVTGQKTARPTDLAMRRFFELKAVRLQQIMRSTRTEVRLSVRDMIASALEQVPRPSAGEVARRIRTTFHGDLGRGGKIRDVVPAPMRPPRRVLPTQRYRLTEGGSLYVFSSERAALIARTELTQAENTGIVDAYEQTGVLGLEWLAYNDGRSGDRRHNEMNGVAVPTGGVFITPLGNRLRYPGDPMAPIRETANCRCTVRGIYDPSDLQAKLQR